MTPATAALARALARLGVVNPATGGSFSEALLFGIGGGIGATYTVLEHSTFVRLDVGGRIHPDVQQRDFLETIGRRLGLDIQVRLSPTPASAEKALREAFTTGHPIIASVDESLLPLRWLPREFVGTTPHPVLLAQEGDDLLVTDMGPLPFKWSWPELGAARARVRSERHRLTLIGPPRQAQDLREAIRAGISETVRGFLEITEPRFGLNALKTWARLVRSRTDPHGWETVFSDPSRLVFALFWIEHATEIAGAGGGNHRAFYAAFLEEAAGLLRDRRLLPIAGQYRALADLWTDLVRTALPEGAPELRKFRELGVQKARLLSEVGGPAAHQMAELVAERWVILTNVRRQGLPAEFGDVRLFLDRLADRLDAIAAGEELAVRALAEIAASGS
jgi:hypothetical protein